jgi:hypothetical protein
MFLCGDTKPEANSYVSSLDILYSGRCYLAKLASIARDRVALLLDQDSPFLELGAFAGYQNQDSTPCANLISGIGNVW